MSDVVDTPDVGEGSATPEVDVEKQAFLDRLNKEGGKRKEAEKRASELEKKLADLTARLDEREAAGLPELERERKRAEQLEKRIQEAEQRAEQSERAVQRTQRERWIAAAAARENFVDPDDAARYLDIDDVEDADQAERAVKRLAKSKQHLVKPEDSGQPQIGRVLEGGKTTTKQRGAGSGIDPEGEATMIADALKKFVRN